MTTWGGYGGAVIGLLLGAIGRNSEKEACGPVSRSARLAAFLITFLTTGGLDGIPPEDAAVARAPRQPPVAPTHLPVADAGGRARPALGVAGVMF